MWLCMFFGNILYIEMDIYKVLTFGLYRKEYLLRVFELQFE